ncbi:protein-L-isoaspartate O-methyltransferase [Sphingomonas sp. CGMCC 1.13654]|uniref:Protein-L-isoaspartate O-methyltransferase n=1 Tax=Sphingomonas chungangi TaxID=2683589 RepID=A0A838LBX9_9SPHN|nr:protein-L-isoaspartate O-methyltransferase [Sphingomonas chungangi]MBA2935646.1 protein-L-isoaspartate O-methyltransferase [Sphingomonas chungangi]MVW54337.1 protein-L-isoaspartate O-methyltransferase [Sphingomonas chungangi]
MSGPDFSSLRSAMVSNQLRTNKVTDAAVLAAMASVPRELFAGEGQGAVCYRDTMVPLGEGRALNPPIATGRLLGVARPRFGEKALVVGSATGYVAALLAEMGCAVTALEESPALVARAQVATVEGPLAAGWPEAAPYDLIYIDGAVERVPDAIVDQLAEGGRLVGAVNERGVTRLVIGRRAAGGFGLDIFADVETAVLPGFAPAPAFTF